MKRERKQKKNEDQADALEVKPAWRKVDELPDVLKVEQVASFLQIGRNTAYELVASGRIPSVQFGRTRRIYKRALLKLLGDDPAEAAGAEGARLVPVDIKPFR